MIALPHQMQAAVYRGGGRVVVETLPVPEIGPGEALVRVRTCGVCGTDLKKIAHDLQSPPRVFGHEIAGTIAALGAGVSGWQVGDRVAVHHHIPCGDCFYCARRAYAHCPTYRRTGTTAGFEPAGGGFAAYIRVMDWIVRRGMVRIPDGIPDEAASMIEPLNTCMKGVQVTRAQAGEAALVIGAGPIGLLYCQLARRSGLRVLAVDLRPERREKALELGAAEAFDAAEIDLPAAARQRTEGRGADLAIVAVADAAVVATALEAVRPAGRVLLFAQTRMGDMLSLDAGQVCALEKAVLGSYSADVDLQEQAAELIFSGAVQVEPLITHRFPLAQIGDALDLAARPRGGSLKVVVSP